VSRVLAVTLALGLLLMAYVPARYVWDISDEFTRGLWSFFAFVALVSVAGSILILIYDTPRRAP